MFLNLLKFIPSWVKYLPLIFVISVGGYLYWENNSLEDNLLEVEKELADEQRTNTLLSFQVEELNSRANRQQIRLENLQSGTRVAREENNRLKAILDSYKGKEEIAIENPEDIERRANDALRSLLLEYECETGNTNSCSK